MPWTMPYSYCSPPLAVISDLRLPATAAGAGPCNALPPFHAEPQRWLSQTSLAKVAPEAMPWCCVQRLRCSIHAREASEPDLEGVPHAARTPHAGWDGGRWGGGCFFLVRKRTKTWSSKVCLIIGYKQEKDIDPYRIDSDRSLKWIVVDVVAICGHRPWGSGS